MTLRDKIRTISKTDPALAKELSRDLNTLLLRVKTAYKRAGVQSGGRGEWLARLKPFIDFLRAKNNPDVDLIWNEALRLYNLEGNHSEEINRFLNIIKKVDPENYTNIVLVQGMKETNKPNKEEFKDEMKTYINIIYERFNTELAKELKEMVLKAPPDFEKFREIEEEVMHVFTFYVNKGSLLDEMDREIKFLGKKYNAEYADQLRQWVKDIPPNDYTSFKNTEAKIRKAYDLAARRPYD